MANNRQKLGGVLLAVAALFAVEADAVLNQISNTRNSKHNLSATAPDVPGYIPGGRDTNWVSTETQICVFCHTPHGATSGTNPLWNRKLSTTASYTPYATLANPGALDAAVIQTGFDGQPGGSSKLCLSCHDGVMAVNSVNVLNGVVNPPNISMTNSIFPANTTGFTSNIGTNLTNDHPISVLYDATLATRDGELRTLDGTTQRDTFAGVDIGKTIGPQATGYRPKLPLKGSPTNAQIQCATCHDPHIVDTDAATKGNQMFLRLNRFQEGAASPTSTTFDKANDQICVACHDKNKDYLNAATGVYIYSVHANSAVAGETYTATPAATRQFLSGLPVWKASCLNCHQGHTVEGAAHLLSEGATGGVKQQEKTCYQCHTSAAATIVTPTTNMKDIQTDFGLARAKPVALANEVHDIGGNFADTVVTGIAGNNCTTTTNKCGADGIESRALLGLTAGNRHVECSDCHNPHRVVKFARFNGPLATPGVISGTPEASATHTHTAGAPAAAHDNIASGALRGTWGVEPTYTNASFQNLPSGYTVKKGDPGTNTVTTVGQPYVTREYQICLKCHSNYAYPDTNANATGGSGSGRPAVGAAGTPSGTNLVTYYTNQAKEFQAPTLHALNTNMNLGTAAGAGNGTTWNNFNNRSWHPVMGPTGRNRGTLTAPWNTFKGTQTMYCSDCHGTDVTSATSVIPNAGGNWGPHGSTNNFVLKGNYAPTDTANPSSVTHALCLKCHAAATYQSINDVGSGWINSGHGKHFDKLGNLRCNWCHAAVPHGWKNKALLVNKNDVGPEVGLAAGTVIAGVTAYNNGPYYVNAYLKVIAGTPDNFVAAASWNNKNQCDHGHADPP